MKSRGVSLAGLLGIVLVFALGMAALKYATAWWTNAGSLAVLALLLTAVAGAIFRRGLDRAYWAGFAIFGWTCLVLINDAWTAGEFGQDLTSGLGDLAELVVPPVESVPTDAPLGVMDPQSMARADAFAARHAKLGNFVQISHMLIVLLFALAGGHVARAFALRTERESAGAGTPSTPRAER